MISLCPLPQTPLSRKKKNSTVVSWLDTQYLIIAGANCCTICQKTGACSETIGTSPGPKVEKEGWELVENTWKVVDNFVFTPYSQRGTFSSETLQGWSWSLILVFLHCDWTCACWGQGRQHYAAPQRTAHASVKYTSPGRLQLRIGGIAIELATRWEEASLQCSRVACYLPIIWSRKPAYSPFCKDRCTSNQRRSLDAYFLYLVIKAF